jgi:hypothetical protein
MMCQFQWTDHNDGGWGYEARHLCDLPAGHLELVQDVLPEELVNKLGLLAHHCHCGERHA